MGGATFSNFNVDAIQEVQGRFMNPVVCVSRGKATTIGNLLTQGNKSTQAVRAQEKPCPDQAGEQYWREKVKPGLTNSDVAGGRSAQVHGEQDCAEDGGAWNNAQHCARE
jgi:hypothetical protein